MKYKIRDNIAEFISGQVFNSKKEILDELAVYHDNDYSGVKDDGKDTPYKDIFEFLATLKDDEARLNWLLEYGEWTIEEVKEKA